MNGLYEHRHLEEDYFQRKGPIPPEKPSKEPETTTNSTHSTSHDSNATDCIQSAKPDTTADSTVVNSNDSNAKELETTTNALDSNGTDPNSADPTKSSESSSKFEIDHHHKDYLIDIPDERLKDSGYWIITRTDVFPKQYFYAVKCSQKDVIPTNEWIVLKDISGPAPKLKIFEPNQSKQAARKKSIESKKKDAARKRAEVKVKNVKDTIQEIRDEHHTRTKERIRRLKSKQLNLIKSQVKVTGKRMDRLMIVSGGQTGVDRAALDVAIAKDIPYRGWIPRGRLAEDGPIDSEKYNHLMECDSDDYAVRTLLNVSDSDATLLLNMGTLEGGSLLTKKYAAHKDRDLMYITLMKSEDNEVEDGGNAERKNAVTEEKVSAVNEGNGSQDNALKGFLQHVGKKKKVSQVHDYCAHFGFSNGRAQRVAEWIRVSNIRVLNVAGPRESDRNGIYRESVKFLNDVLRHFEKGNIPDGSLFGAYGE